MTFTRVPTRREFLATGSGLVAGLVFAPALRATSRPDTARGWLGDPADPERLRQLASAGVDAARAAGAEYADVRVGQQQIFSLTLPAAITVARVEVGGALSYGVRVLVDGTWGFVHGVTPTPDAVAQAARSAVLRARGYARLTRARVTLAPAPIARGEWRTPVVSDPFTVPVRDQVDILGALTAAYVRVAGVAANTSETSVAWTAETRVFASSEGAMTTQQLTTARPNFGISTAISRRAWLPAASAGVEYLLTPGLEERIKAFAEESVRYGSFPSTRGWDVGRYPAVFDGASMARLIGEVTFPALELDRVLKLEADSVGTSYLAPPATVLGTSIMPPSVTIGVSRAVPHANAVQWDDEGVTPQDVTLVDRGRLVDYVTTRSTAPALSEWYAQQGMTLRSHGYATSSSADRITMPMGTFGAMAPATDGPSLEAMIKDISRGVLVLDASWTSDQGLMSGQSETSDGRLFAIQRGQITHRMYYAGVQFRTPQLWKALTAVGSAGTVAERWVPADKGQPSQPIWGSAAAPAAFFSEVDVFSNPRQYY